MTIFFFLLGLAVGSFLNSVIFRLEKQESVIKHRSYCPYCKQTLAWFELIPLMSFILQKGKCRKCGRRISSQYPLVEFLTGLLFALVYNFSAQGGPASGWQLSIFNFQSIFNLQLVFWLFVISCLIVIFVYDLKHYIIPNEVVYSGIILAFLFRLFEVCLSAEALAKAENLVLGILPALFFLAIILVSRGKWMGMGDVKLAVFMGLVLGWPNILVALFLAFLIGAFASLVLITLKKKTLKSEIPFGPFLAGATIIAIFIGDILLNWYMGLFL